MRRRCNTDLAARVSRHPAMPGPGRGQAALPLFAQLGRRSAPCKNVIIFTYCYLSVRDRSAALLYRDVIAIIMS